MASLVLGAIGTSLGGAFSGSILGMSGAAIGGLIGSTVGSVVDSWIVSALTPDQRFEGQRLDAQRVTSATEGAVLPRLHGRMRIGGNVIWATDFREQVVVDRQGGGKGIGGGGGVVTTSYLYFASFAVALCEGPITGIGRIWVDGKPMDLQGVTWRWYPGDEDQTPDPFIATTMGPDATPAYRGTAYVVFEELALERFGNRIPQLTFEVIRAMPVPGSAEGQLRAVTIIPASGEFAYGTTIVRREDGAETTGENANADPTTADFEVSLDRLQASLPGVESVSLVVSWFGDDLRAAQCQIRPGVELEQKSTLPYAWSVNGVSRSGAHLVSRSGGRPVYGGTPSDRSIVEAIAACKARGLRVTFYPFVLMDIPSGNTRPNPYSAGASQIGQAAFPWRGRITCSPAPGFEGTPDRTAEAADQVAAVFGAAEVGDFAVAGSSVSWTGGADWGLRRMILHYAHLCAAAGGVDAFLIGSELRGLTTIRDSASTYPTVAALRDLAGDARAVLGPTTKISYAADWSEYFGHHPQDGSGDVFFHLDPLWADEQIDFVGIDNYMPLSDWRDGFDHADAAQAPWVHDQAYLRANIAGGEGFDWFYASDADRAAQNRTPITDGAGKPWVFRYKDLRGWWENPHFDRPGGIEAATPTPWVAQSKPVWFTEFGCPAVDRGTNQPNVFHDPKSSESALPYFSRGWRDDAIQRAYLEATLSHWSEVAHNPHSSVYGGPMVHLPDSAAWTWDARPYPFFPELTEVWGDGAHWRLGHWLTGRLGAVSLQALVRDLCLRAGLAPERIDVAGLFGAVEGYAITALEAPRASIAVLARHFGFDAFESEGRVVFRMRGGPAVATLAYRDLVRSGAGDVLEIERAQETELPQALKWSVARADGDYDAIVVEARRVTVDSRQIAAEQYPLAVAPEEVDRRVRRALQEAWVARESLSLRLPPSRLALNPGDVVDLDHDGRAYSLRLVSLADGEDRNVSAVLSDRAVHDLPPGSPRLQARARTVLFGRPVTEFLDLPQLTEADSAAAPLLGVDAVPWPGEIAVFRSPTLDGFDLLGTVGARAQFGTTLEALPAGPTSRLDLGNALVVELRSGTLQSVTDLQLFGGANSLALETAPGVWEIVQAGMVELIGPRQYRLRRLLRGQRGTEGEMVPLLAPGARVVVLNSALVSLPLADSEIGLPWNWRIGPASLPFTDDAFRAETYTPNGRGLQPFSVAHIEQPWRRGRVPGDLTLRWIRRDRALAADSWPAVDVPLSEASEAYEVDIMDGESVLRTLATTAPSVTYAGADQISDFGTLLGPGDTLSIRVAQLSGLVGRGRVQTVTLEF